MEFMDNGDISGFISAHKKFKKPVREEEYGIFYYNVCMLYHIYIQKNIIHRDIKPANLFMTIDKIIKLEILVFLQRYKVYKLQSKKKICFKIQ